MSISIKTVQLPHAKGLPLPAYQSAGAAGMDLVAALAEDADMTLLPGERTAVPTGIIMAIPHGYEGQMRPRSGLARNHGIGLTNTPGTIDSDYRGEIFVLLINLGAEPFTVTRGMRIAQLVIAPVIQAVLVPTESLDETQRGAGGFGSTGRAA